MFVLVWWSDNLLSSFFEHRTSHRTRSFTRVLPTADPGAVVVYLFHLESPHSTCSTVGLHLISETRYNSHALCTRNQSYKQYSTPLISCMVDPCSMPHYFESGTRNGHLSNAVGLVLCADVMRARWQPRNPSQFPSSRIN